MDLKMDHLSVITYGVKLSAENLSLKCKVSKQARSHPTTFEFTATAPALH
jgi:hypothetical protein